MKKIEDSEQAKQLAIEIKDIFPQGAKYDGVQIASNCQVWAWVLLLKLPRGVTRMGSNRVNFCPETSHDGEVLATPLTYEFSLQIPIEGKTTYTRQVSGTICHQESCKNCVHPDNLLITNSFKREEIRLIFPPSN